MTRVWHVFNFLSTLFLFWPISVFYNELTSLIRCSVLDEGDSAGLLWDSFENHFRDIFLNVTHITYYMHAQFWVGMGTETRYLIGLGAKLWKTGVSISSDVNGSAIGTGEIKKTHIHLLLLYIHIILPNLSRQSHQLFLYAIIFKLLSMMHFCYSQIRSRSRGRVSARATWKPCLC